MKRRMVVALLTLIICVSTPAQDILKLLNQFDNDSEVTVANQFFDELLKDEFIDENVSFAEGTPVDSLQQQVWYWAAEWYYDSSNMYRLSNML